MVPPARILATAVAAIASGLDAAGAWALRPPPDAVHLAACSLTCTASATAFADAGETVNLYANATLSGCSGSASYDWDFGDGSPHSSLRNPTFLRSVSFTTPSWPRSTNSTS